MLIKLFISFFILTMSTYSLAQTEIEKKTTALLTLKKYSETVACDTNFEEEKSVSKFINDVYTIDTDTEPGGVTYFILWQGDIGCNGGSGTNSYIISEVSHFRENDPFLVKNNDAFGEDFSNSINMRFIESLKQISPTQFIVVSFEHAEDDANNFPSKKYQYTLENIDYTWKVTHKKPLK